MSLQSFRRLVHAVFASAISLPLLASTGCDSVPMTGRSQLNYISQAEETALGEQAWGEALSSARVIEGTQESAMVQRIGGRIVEVAKREFPERADGLAWEFVLIDDPQMVNAWALPGGKSAVYTGLLTVAENEDQLAAVMGHEVAHVIAAHGAERVSQQMASNIGMQVGSIALGTAGVGESQMIMAAIGAGMQYGVMLPFSRTHESEADHIGLMMMAEAGYDPRAAVQLWENMAAAGGEQPAEFMSTHPSHGTRIADLEALMPEALDRYRRATGRAVTGAPWLIARPIVASPGVAARAGAVGGSYALDCCRNHG